MENALKVEQISIFLENRAGRLAEVIHALAGARINIRALSLTDTSDFGILRLIVHDPEKAQAVLREKGFTFGPASVVAVEIPDRPGGLDSLLQLLSTASINVEYMYDFVQKAKDSAVVIFRFDRVDEAIDLLLGANFKVIPADRICAE